MKTLLMVLFLIGGLNSYGSDSETCDLKMDPSKQYTIKASVVVHESGRKYCEFHNQSSWENIVLLNMQFDLVDSEGPYSFDRECIGLWDLSDCIISPGSHLNYRVGSDHHYVNGTCTAVVQRLDEDSCK